MISYSILFFIRLCIYQAIVNLFLQVNFNRELGHDINGHLSFHMLVNEDHSRISLLPSEGLSNRGYQEWHCINGKKKNDEIPRNYIIAYVIPGSTDRSDKGFSTRYPKWTQCYASHPSLSNIFRMQQLNTSNRQYEFQFFLSAVLYQSQLKTIEM